MFSLEQRKKFIEKAFINQPKIKVMTYSGLTIDFCKKMMLALFYAVYVIQVILNLKRQLHILIVNYQK